MLRSNLFNSRFFVFGCYLILALVVFLQLTFQLTSLKWDTLDYVLPVRYIIGDAIHHFQLPVWNTYSQMGSPICTDPQTWYPVTWIIGGIFGYSYSAMNYDYILHVALAGYAFFILSSYMKLSKPTSFALGICYMFSGFFISNSEHTTWIASAAWLPLVLYYSHKITKTQSLALTIKAALCLSMIVTGGYPAFLFVLFYILAPYYLYLYIRKFLNKEYNLIGKLFLHQFLFLGLTLLFSLSLVSSYVLLNTEMHRNGQIPEWMVMTNPFPANAVASFLFPFLLIKREYFTSDMSMTNAYFGVVPFVFLLFGILQRTSRLQKFLFLSFLFLLLTSFGEGWFLRKFLFDHVPLMNLFRHPGMFRIFAIIPVLLFAGIAMDTMVKREQENSYRFAKIFLLIVLLAFIVTSIAAYAHGTIGFGWIRDPSRLCLVQTLNVWDCIFAQSLSHILILFFVLVLFFWKKQFIRRQRTLLFLLLICGDMFFAVQLNFYLTIGTPDEAYSASRNDKALNSINSNVIAKLSSSSFQSQFYNPERLAGYLNTNIYYKVPSNDGYSPFMLKDYVRFFGSKWKVISDSNTIMYFPAKFHLNSDSMVIEPHGAVYSTEETRKYFSPDAHDSVWVMNAEMNGFTAKVKTQKGNLLVLMQNYSPYWVASVNAKEAAITRVNFNMMAINVPPGISEIKFKFSPKQITYSFFLSSAVLILALIFIFIADLKSRSKEKNTLPVV